MYSAFTKGRKLQGIILIYPEKSSAFLAVTEL